MLDEKRKTNTDRLNAANYIAEKEIFSQNSLNKITDVFQNEKGKAKYLQKYFITVNIESHKVPFEGDSGCRFYFISGDKFHKLKIPVQLQDSTLVF